MKENAVSEKSMAFAVRIVNLYKYLSSRRKEGMLSVQILRSGTSIGANIREANSAQSKADFIAKCCISLKECDETGYWLDLLHRTSYVSDAQFTSLEADRMELFALLTTIIKSAKASQSRS